VANRGYDAKSLRPRALAQLRVTLATTEEKLYGLQEALAEARKPFWRRWLG